MRVCFEFLSVGARGDRSPYSGDGWAAHPGLSSPSGCTWKLADFHQSLPSPICREAAAAETPAAAGAGFIPVFLFSFLFSTSINFIQLNPSLQTVLLHSILAQTRFIFPKHLRHLLRRVPHVNVAEGGSSRKRRQTHEKEDLASSIMRFLWVCLFPRVEEVRKGAPPRLYGSGNPNTLCMSTGGVAKITRLSLSAQVLEAESHWASLQY